MSKKIKKMVVFSLITTIGLLLALFLVGCTALSVGGSLTINENGTGSREFVITVLDSTNDSGNAYKYMKKHGQDLEDWLKSEYETAITNSVIGNDAWLDIKVTPLADNKETIKISFSFSSFADYTQKLTLLAKFDSEEIPAGFQLPTLTRVGAESSTIYSYYEKANMRVKIFDNIKNKFIGSDDLLDITAGGTNSDNQTTETLRDYGLEVGGAEVLTVKLGKNETKNITGAVDVDIKFNFEGSDLEYERDAAKLVLHYDFNDNLENKGEYGAAANLTKGEESSKGEFVEGINGKAYSFDGGTYLHADANYSFSEMTISFYYKANSWTEVDNGANTILVNSGLDALGSGALDVQFYKNINNIDKPVVFMSKTNGSSWQDQDKMETETYFNSRLNEWHNYVIVYERDYKSNGEFDDSYITLYIDGQRINRIKQYHTSGLPIVLGKEYGFNVGGYYEAIVKRALDGALDELKIYDGILTQSEVKEMYNKNSVSKVYDPSDATNTEVQKNTDKDKDNNKNDNKTDVKKILIIVFSIVGGLAVVGVVVFIVMKTKRKKQ